MNLIFIRFVYIVMFRYVILLLLCTSASAHEVRLRIIDAERGRPLGGVSVRYGSQGTISSNDGMAILHGIEQATRVMCTSVGYDTVVLNVTPTTRLVDVSMQPSMVGAGSITIRADRTAEREAFERPVLTDVTTAAQLTSVAASSLADGLSFQPGLRLETDCRNCGFTQARMNGLPGPYTRLLIDGRPVMSALAGVYGLEQIPVAMIDRIDVVRGAGDVTTGPTAIAGTIDVVTRMPRTSLVDVRHQRGWFGQRTPDVLTSATASTSVDHGSHGETSISLFGAMRDRMAYDRDGDGFSEATSLWQRAGGLRTRTMFDTGLLGPCTVDGSATWIRETRRGGDNLDRAPYLAAIAEQLDHAIAGGSVRVEAHPGDMRISAGVALQHTDRQSYYGGLGPTPTSADSAVARLYFGNTTDMVLDGFARVDLFPELLRSAKGTGTISVGMDHTRNSVDDRMPGYARRIDQTTTATGGYVRLHMLGTTPWPGILDDAATWSVLVGARLDVLRVDGLYDLGTTSIDHGSRTFVIATPRVNADVMLTPDVKARFSYAMGFRGPQAFDEDLHVSTLSGEARVVRLADDLQPERSHAVSLAMVQQPEGGFGWTLDGFATVLQRPFVTSLTTERAEGSDAWIALKRNGDPAFVGGVHAEVRYDDATWATRPRFTMQVAASAQVARYLRDGGEVIVDTVRSTRFARTPEVYGSWIISYSPMDDLQLTVNGVVTGPMLVPNERTLDVRTSPTMVDAGVRVAWRVPLWTDMGMDVIGGMHNVFDVYQRDLERGASRDGSYVYGPVRPCTLYVGITISTDTP